MKNARKIDAMHQYYGYGDGCCQDCPHFVEKLWDRKYFKCKVYGDSNSEATDWRKGYVACGLIDMPFPEGERRVVDRIVYHKETEQLPGQISIDDLEGGVMDGRAVYQAL
jgi:hypothetical protein